MPVLRMLMAHFVQVIKCFMHAMLGSATGSYSSSYSTLCFWYGS